MDTRADFQKLLEHMDKVILAKRQELTELDERLESARSKLSEKEARELEENDDTDSGDRKQITIQQLEDYMKEQRRIYEQQLDQLGNELSELESINQEIAKEKASLRSELGSCKEVNEKLKFKSLELSKSLQEAESANLDLNLRLAKAESELQMKQRLLKKSHNEDEILLDVLNDKLESLNKAIELRDEEIKRLRYENELAFESLGINVRGTGGESDKIYSQRAANSLTADNNNLINSKFAGTESALRVAEISKAFKEKDDLIALLKSQLSEATKDLERSANVLELSIKHKVDEVNSGVGAINSISPVGESGEQLIRKCKMLESELEAKDRELHEAEFRNHNYEKVLPTMISDLVQKLARNIELERENGSKPELLNASSILNLIENLNKLLNEFHTVEQLLNKIDHLNRLNETKGAQIEQLVNELNQLDAKFNLVQQQCDLLRTQPNGREGSETVRQQAGGHSAEQSKGLEDRTCEIEQCVKNNQADANPSTDKQPDAGECQEADKVGSNGSSTIIPNEQSIKRAPRVAALSNQNELTVACGYRPESAHDNNNNNNHSNNDKEDADDRRLINESRGSISKAAVRPLVRACSFRTSLSRPTFALMLKSAPSIDTALNLEGRLRQLENENELLELAMKEILLSIRCTDARCKTILIDCPSLERLCKLIEARFLTKLSSMAGEGANLPALTSSAQQVTGCDLFQFFVLKSELDSLRGQNNQLRMDMKAQHRQLHEFLTIECAKTEAEPANTSAIHGQDKHLSERVFRSDAGQPREVECQTEPVVLHSQTTAHKTPSWIAMIDDDKRDSDNYRAKCPSCTRLVDLANHLFQCIVRIESRVHVSDENYLSRLISSRQLMQALERDLMIYKSLLNESRRACHSLMQQKIIAESRVQYLDGQMSAHLNVCPLTHSKDENKRKEASEVGTSTKSEVVMSASAGKISERLDISSGSGQQRENSIREEARMTIKLLQSIIGCLQAQLVSKDERLRHLETILLEHEQTAPTGTSLARRPMPRKFINVR